MKFILSATTVALFAALSSAHAITGPFNANYQATRLSLDNIAGRAEIVVGGSAGISVAITGDPAELATVDLKVENGTLKIRSTRHMRRYDRIADAALYRISVPKGTDLTIDNMVGEIQAGDLGGDLSIDSGALKGSIGAVRSAHLDGSGALKLTIGDIAGELAMDASGAANIRTGSVDSANLDVSGAGDIDIQDIRHGLHAELSGASQVDARSVNGPVDVEVSGSGDIRIAGGRADPLEVDISGIGSFEFGGTAVNPQLSVSGRGRIKLKAYTGKLNSDGANITIGD